MIFRAIEFAARAHRDHYRKGTRIPYLIHPLNVAKILIEYGCPEEVVVAGILHDTTEDTPVTSGEIREEFGDKVASLVAAASEPDKSDTWENRKNHTIDYLKTAPMDVLILSCADKLDNVKSIIEDVEKDGESVWGRFRRPKDDQEWYYRSLAEIFNSRAGESEAATSLFRRYALEVKILFG
ncbi:MAG TPA: HD domain-containing protein [Syntrophales bacterium]|nr:HD domain-containing protein [Syntrophales bacterium]HOX95424.1 HD domain-containing protein [Syntrophales bacterium]HPI58537.1 HD domain-containing protein [Syntrophales bacterium]HPN25631.1 HD domain-containing protein [Syntrophales bacterium]HQM28111.1 HD domain-containing protein [Syntrophales bacterium]